MIKKGKAVTGKLSSDLFTQLNEFLEQNPEEYKSGIIAKAVQQFLNPAKEKQELENEYLQLQKTVNELSGNNTRLEAEIMALESKPPPDNKKEEEIVNLNNSIETRNETIKNLQNENKQLKNQEPKPFKLDKNQLLITIAPVLWPFLIEVANRETNRTGKTITADMILLNLFWAQVSKGAGDHLPMTFSPREIARRLETVKQAASNE